MLRRVLRYAPPNMTLMRFFNVHGASADELSTILNVSRSELVYEIQSLDEVLRVGIGLRNVWLADRESRESSFKCINDGLRKLGGICAEKEWALTPSAVAMKNEDYRSDYHFFSDLFILHFESRIEQKQFCNDMRKVTPCFVARFGRAPLSRDGVISSCVSTRYSRGGVSKAVHWQSTEPVHVDRMRSCMTALMGASAFEHLELVPFVDIDGRPSVRVNCIDGAYFAQSFQDATLLLLALSSKACRTAKQAGMGQTSMNADYLFDLHSAAVQGLSAACSRTKLTLKSYFLMVISSLRKEFQGIEVSVDELMGLYAGLYLRLNNPNILLPVTDNELLISLRGESASLALSEDHKFYGRGDEVFRTFSSVWKKIDKVAIEAIESDLRSWLNDELDALAIPVSRDDSDKKNSSSPKKQLISPNFNAQSTAGKIRTPREKSADSRPGFSGEKLVLSLIEMGLQPEKSRFVATLRGGSNSILSIDTCFRKLNIPDTSNWIDKVVKNLEVREHKVSVENKDFVYDKNDDLIKDVFRDELCVLSLQTRFSDIYDVKTLTREIKSSLGPHVLLFPFLLTRNKKNGFFNQRILLVKA